MDYKVVELKEIDKRLRKLYERGEDAAKQKNYSYAMEMFRELLLKVPGALEVRQRLREMQFQEQGGKSSFFNSLLVNSVAVPFWVWNLFLLRGDDKKVLKAADNAEKLLGFDATAMLPLTMLDRAMFELDLPEVSVQVLEWAVNFHPKSVSLLSRLASAYSDAGMGTKCLAVYRKLQQLAPKDKRWLEAVKDATAEAAMTAGGWNKLARGEGDYREVIRDTGEAQRLEQAGRTVKSEEGLRAMLEGALQTAEEQGSYESYRQVAELYADLKEYDNAIEWYQKTIDKSEINDPAIEQALIKTQIRKYDAEVAELEKKALDETLDDDQRQALLDQANEVREQKAGALLQALRERVRKNPNIHQERLELAKMLLEQGETEEALGHLQKLQTHPNLGVTASFYLGMCFTQKKVYDLAIEQFNKVKDQITNMTPLKKDAIYHLAKVYEASGNEEEAITAYKSLYAEDVEYRDVAQIIDNLYRE